MTGSRHRGVRAIKRAAAWTMTVALVIGGVSAAGSAASAAEAVPQSVAGASASTASAVDSVVKTADLSKFQAGNIISDAAFFNAGTMSEAQIQSFLQAKVPTCQSGYVCLKDWYDTSRTTSADAMCGAYSGGIRERASTIIFRVAQACGINPQVLLVMLQKEQGLVLHTWPSDWRYTIAMGQGCPDTAACDTRYYGFFNQVYGAAWQMKRYANPAGTSQYFTWYAPGKTWNVRWHPNEACGSSPVYIQNQATANLYYYTPYQPNAAAIRAGYGEGDGCSSYGNRNFYQYFTDWFGAVALPTIASIDSSNFVMATDSTGVLWGYPFGKTGRWGAPQQLGSLGNDIVRTLSVGDFDGDGRRDVIGVDASGGAWLYPGDGVSTFGARQSLGVDWSGALLVTSAGDFDGDGSADVFTTGANGNLLVWRGTGVGSFRAPTVAGVGWNSMNLLSGGTDMDGDGVADLIARDSAGVLYVYLADGRGNWRTGLRVGGGWSGMTAAFSPGDFSGDGLADLLARDGAGDLWFYNGTGAGSIAGGSRVGVGWQGMTSIVGRGAEPSSPSALPAGAGDVDSDGARDVLASTQDGRLLIYRGDGRGGWRGSIVADPAWGAGRFVTLGDFSEDGISDVGRVRPDGGFELLVGRGDGTFGPPALIGSGWGGMDLILGGVDFDGDRNVDVISRNAQGDLLLYRGNGQGGWQGGGTTIGNGWSNFSAIFYAGDFDSNGEPDLLARAADGALVQYTMTGKGSFNGSWQVGSGWGSFTAIFSPGAFDSTGGSDVLARSQDGRLLLYRGNGRGGWLDSVAIGQGWDGMVQLG